MSSASTLSCNRCWVSLSPEEPGYVTACSHIFCAKDAAAWFHMHTDCPACKRVLNRETEIKLINLDPQPMLLWGLSLASVMEIASSSIEFYDYQKKIEGAFRKHQIDDHEKKVHIIEQKHNAEKVEYQNSVNSLSQKINALMEENKLKQRAFANIESEYHEISRRCAKFEELYSQKNKRTAPLITHHDSSPSLHSSSRDQLQFCQSTPPSFSTSQYSGTRTPVLSSPRDMRPITRELAGDSSSALAFGPPNSAHSVHDHQRSSSSAPFVAGSRSLQTPTTMFTTGPRSTSGVFSSSSFSGARPATPSLLYGKGAPMFAHLKPRNAA